MTAAIGFSPVRNVHAISGRLLNRSTSHCAGGASAPVPARASRSTPSSSVARSIKSGAGHAPKRAAINDSRTSGPSAANAGVNDDRDRSSSSRALPALRIRSGTDTDWSDREADPNSALTCCGSLAAAPASHGSEVTVKLSLSVSSALRRINAVDDASAVDANLRSASAGR